MGSHADDIPPFYGNGSWAPSSFERAAFSAAACAAQPQRLWLHVDDLDDDDGDDNDQNDDNDDNDVEVWHKHHKRVLADLPPLSAWLTLV